MLLVSGVIKGVLLRKAFSVFSIRYYRLSERRYASMIVNYCLKFARERTGYLMLARFFVRGSFSAIVPRFSN